MRAVEYESEEDVGQCVAEGVDREAIAQDVMEEIPSYALTYILRQRDSHTFHLLTAEILIAHLE